MFYNVMAGLVKIFLFPFYRIKVFGKENIPEGKGIIVCANHWSNLDPFFLAISLPIKFNFMAKKELFEIPVLRGILSKAGVFPVDRQGSDIKSLRHAMSVIKDGKTLGIFPEGTRVKEVNRENMHEGVGFIALKSYADILPVEIITSYRLFSKVEIHVKEPIKIETYSGLKNKEAMNRISDDVFEKIYESRKILGRENNENNNC